MKKLFLRIVLAITLLLPCAKVFADLPGPPPSANYNNSGGNGRFSVGVPVDKEKGDHSPSGNSIILSLALIFGSIKVYKIERTRKKIA